MTRVDMPEDTALESDLRSLEHIGLRRDLLKSRKHTDLVHSLLAEDLETCARFALKYCAVAKRRASSPIPKIKALDREAIVEALKLYSSRPVYLWWRNPSW